MGCYDFEEKFKTKGWSLPLQHCVFLEIVNSMTVPKHRPKVDDVIALWIVFQYICVQLSLVLIHGVCLSVVR